MSKKCKENNILCDYKEIDGICSFESHCGKQIIITNADKIRSMSDEELAEWLDVITNDEREDWNPIMCAHCIYHETHHEKEYCNDCEFGKGLLNWLQSEVEE